MSVDTHCHLDDARYDRDRTEVVSRARAAGVVAGLVPGTARAQWPRARALAAELGWAFAVGTHPQCLPDGLHVPDDVTAAAAVGECGLDGGVPVPMDEQVRVLEAHLALARDAGLPVILHVRRAHHVALPLLRRWAPLRGVLHSYSGGAELVPGYVALGLHLSYSGILTHDNAHRPRHAARVTPLDRLLAETDGPDQCPRPRSGRNEPAYLVHVIEAMEALRAQPLGAALAENARSLFGEAFRDGLRGPATPGPAR